MSEVLVLAETAGSAVRTPTLELLAAARRLGEPSAVVFGEPDDAVVATLSEHGATTVYAVPAPEAQEFLSVPKAEALVALAQRTSPVAVLVTSGSEGKDVAARVAVRLDSGIVTDAVSIGGSAGAVTATQSIVSGTQHATSEFRRGTPVITLVQGAVSAEPAPAQASVQQVDVSFSEQAAGTQVASRTEKTSTGRPDLTDAEVVVAVGRGVGTQDGLDVIEQLADALGAAVGATRAVTDLGWAPHELQVGQTGKTVAPNVYIAAGLSGAIQHRAGMQSSRTIVAVNKDPKAPIFAISDLGVVGDLHAVLPALTDEIKRRKG